MDKSRRLKVYSEKDYSELIEFPVELVGRDGVVRRYSYSDSVKIYRRRIESAHVRYSDLEVINAEISHCTKRLEQLHRSWKQRMRRFEREYVQNRPVPQDRQLYERGKKFLRVYLERHAPDAGFDPESRELNLVLLEDRPDCQVFYVNWQLFHPGTLLYAYRLDGDQGDARREEYHQYLTLLKAIAHAPDTEKLLHHECGPEIAFILSGPRATPMMPNLDGGRSMLVQFLGMVDGVAGEPPALVATRRGRSDDDGDPFRAGLEELRWNNFEEAFDQFTKALEENPFYKEAYWALADIAHILDRWDDVEPYLLMALKYFGKEPRAHFYWGRMLLHRKDLEGAERAFARAVQLNMKQGRGVGFLACTQGLRGHHGRAAATLQGGLGVFPRDGLLLRLAGPLHRALRLHRWVRFALLASTLLMVSLVLATASPVAWAVVAAVEVVIGAMALQRKRRIRAELWDWARQEGASLAPRPGE